MPNSQDKKWVILFRKRPKKGPKGPLKQIGPYSVKEVNDLLKEGKVQYQDYAWSKGFQSWERIKNVPEFQYKIKAEKIDKMKKSFPVEEHTLSKPLIKRSEVQAESKNTVNEIVPEEVENKDLVQEHQHNKAFGKIKEEENDFSEETSTEIRYLDQSDSEEFVKSEVFERTSVQEPSIKKELPKFYKMLSLSILVFSSSLLIFMTLPKWIKSSKKGLQKEAALTKVKKIAKVKKIKVRKKNKKAKVKINPKNEVIIKKKSPTFITTHTESLSTNSPQLRVVTNGTAHFSIKIRLWAKMGGIVKKPGYYKFWKYNPKGGEILVKLDALNLSSGTYHYEVSYGDIQNKGKFFLGQWNKKFQQDLWQQKKRNSFYKIEEKRILYISLKRVDKIIKAFVQTKGLVKSRHYSKLLSKLNTLKRSDSFKRKSPFSKVWQGIWALRDDLVQRRYKENELLSRNKNLMNQIF